MRIYNIKEKIKEMSKRGFFDIFIGNSFVKLLTFSSSIFIVRLLSVTDFGILSYVDNLVSFFLIINGIGVATSILRYMSMDSEIETKYAFVLFGFKAGLFFNLIITILFLLFIKLFRFPFQEVGYWLLLLTFYPTTTFIIDYGIMILRGNFENKKFARVSVFYSLITLVLLLTMSTSFGLHGVVIARYTSAIITIFLLSYLLKKLDTKKIIMKRHHLNKNQKKEFLSYSFYSMLANSLSLILPINEGFFVNNIIADPIVSAQYKTALQIPMGIQFISTSIIVFIFPYFSKNSRNKKWIWENTKKVQLILIVFFAIFSVIAVVFTPVIVSVVYGKQYIEIVPLMRTYWIVFSINAGFRILPGNVLSAIGRAKFNTINAFITMVFHLLLCLFLIKNFGVIGVPYGLLSAYIVSGTISWIYLKKTTQVLKKEE